jgi:hypothetical protein
MDIQLKPLSIEGYTQIEIQNHQFSLNSWYFKDAMGSEKDKSLPVQSSVYITLSKKRHTNVSNPKLPIEISELQMTPSRVDGSDFKGIDGKVGHELFDSISKSEAPSEGGLVGLEVFFFWLK